MPEEIQFTPYPVAGVGMVIAHEGDTYAVQVANGRVYGYRAPGGTPLQQNAASDIATAIANPPAFPVPSTIMTSEDFLERFTSAELVAIFTSAVTNVITFRTKLIAAKQFPLDSSKLLTGMTVLVSQGIITNARRTALLAP